MPGAKERMREKKMKNQPRSVQYSSRGQGSQASGWVRGHQAAGHRYSQDLPKHITASFFAGARAAEVSVMLKAVSKPTGSCQVFTALPKHMRRRAMSHNTHRLPLRLRDAALRLAERSQRGPEKPPQAKSRSRRARRRHTHLLLEFNRRQRRSRWLETHIWHAKRFHMQNSWSYRLPHTPTAKSYRASYRAMDTHTLLQDLSYFCCLELQGPEEQILRALSQLTSKQTGPTFAASVCLSGARVGRLLLYRAGQYPHGALGPVEFLWRPRAPERTHRQLWIWIHPALKQDVLPELQAVCQCCESVCEVSASSSAAAVDELRNRKRKCTADAAELPAKRLLGDGTRAVGDPVHWESADTHITISDLTMEIVRFRLIGPLAHLVLTDTLHAANEEALRGVCVDADLHQQQRDVFTQLRGVCSTAELPAGCVLGLTVSDPRLTLPQRRGKTVPDLQHISTESSHARDLTLRGVPAHCSQSALWDTSVRDHVTDSRLSEQELNRVRSDVLVPGSAVCVSGVCAVPLLLLHQPGRVCGQERLRWGSGWDLLLPKGWAMAFWVPLVYRGVRVGGLHMSVKHAQFMAQPHFPHDYPDCPAGERCQSEQEAELLEKFKRRPPSKRTNYVKHGCVAPFRCPWQQLVDEWAELVELGGETQSRAGPVQFTVLRSVSVLRQLSAWCSSASAVTPAAAAALHQEQQGALLWVRLRLLGKGRPELHAAVCVPTTSDLQQLTDGQSSGPQEPRHPDPQPESEGSRSVVSHCSRRTLGWVQQGDFSLSSGRGEALAFISLSGLLQMMIQHQRSLVLLRNPSSLQYRYAHVYIDS